MDQKELRKQVTKSVSSVTHDEIKQAWQRFGMGLLVFVGVVITVLLLIMVQRGTATRAEAEADPLEDPISTDELAELAAQTAQAFLAAETVAQKARHVVEPRRVLPLMQKYYRKHPMDTRQFKAFVDHRPHFAGGREFFMGTVVFKDGNSEFWVFEKDAEDAVKLQWEVAVTYADKDWDTFVETKDTVSSSFRVLLERLDEFYLNYDFSDESDPDNYECFLVRVPYSERYVYGYLEKSNDDYITSAGVWNVSSLKVKPVTAKIRFLENAKGDQVLIEDIENFSWVRGVDM